MSLTEFGRSTTVALPSGHEFDFEVVNTTAPRSIRPYAERWLNNRLPLDADAIRQLARAFAEQRLRSRGLI